MADQREAEDRRLRAELRREEDLHMQQQLALEKQQRLDQQQPRSVQDMRRRIDSNNPPTPPAPPAGYNPNSAGYSQYANVSGLPDPSAPQPQDPSSGPGAPPPPQRNSSYDSFNQHQQRASFRNSNSYQDPNSSTASASLPSALKNWQQEPVVPAKKSVSFNTQMNTYKERTPQHSVSSYKSSTGSEPGGLDVTEQPPPVPQPPLEHQEVFDSNNLPSPPPPHPQPPVNNIDSPQQNGPHYNSTKTTPNVIGAQEVYRDPRSRIAAERASSKPGASAATDRMSFREKMKYFAQEAGEDSVKNKPRASKTLRNIESKLS